MWEISSLSQLSASLFAFLLGIGLSLIYDIIKATRKIGFNSYVIVFLGDILFSILSAVITFLFLLVFTNGELRGFILFFETLGFIFSRLTLSRLFLKFLILIFSFFKRLLSKMSTLLLQFSYKTERFLLNLFLNLKKLLKKAQKE